MPQCALTYQGPLRTCLLLLLAVATHMLLASQSDIQMHSYQNGTSERCKRDNWELIQRVCQRHELQLPTKLVEGTIQGEPGAAVSLLEYMYEKFSGKK